MYPSEGDIWYYDATRDTVQHKLQERDRKVRDNFSRLLQDHDLISRLESELDDLVRVTSLGRERRFFRRSDVSGSTPGHTQADTAPVDAEPISLGTSGASSSGPSSSGTFPRDTTEPLGDLRSRYEAMRYLSMTEDDPLAEPIVNFHLRHSRVLDSTRVPQDVASELVRLYHVYKRSYSHQPFPTARDVWSHDALWHSNVRDRVLEMKNIIR